MARILMSLVQSVRVLLVGLLLLGMPVPAAAQTSDSGTSTPPEFSAELVSCLQKTLGQAAYAEITSGDREATEDEFDAGEPCFEQFGPKPDESQPVDASKLNFAPGTDKCLKEKLGENYKTEFAGKKTKEEAKAFRSKTKDCFGKNVAGNGPSELPEEVRSCIVGAVGQAAADEMFKGKPPEPGSDAFKTIESAKCFKNFGPPPGHDRGELSAEAQACVEGIMGDVRGEPTEEQKQQIGKECFGGQGGPGGPQMPAEVQSCLEASFGDSLDDLKKGPEFLTDEQKSKADECFRKNNFRPGGDGPPGGPEMPEEQRQCIEGIMGSARGEPTEEQRQQIGKECFGNQGGPGGPGGPEGGPGGNLPADKRECVERIMGTTRGEPTEEQKQQIGKECFGGQGGPGGEQAGSAPGGQQGGPKNECVERITGGQPPTAEQQAKIGQECFGGQSQGQPQTQPPGGQQSQPQQSNPGVTPAPGTTSGQAPATQGQQPSGTQQACVDRITGGQPPTEAQRLQIEKECFAR